MSDIKKRRDWNVSDEIGAAIVDVLRYVLNAPEDVGKRCITDDKFVRKLFEDPAIGNIDVPSKVKTLFLEEGERERKDKGSVIIEMPPRSTSTQSETDGDALLSYVLCCYKPWESAGDMDAV